jgi:uncharacterized membrane protein YqaE (UPF0057 family)
MNKQSISFLKTFIEALLIEMLLDLIMGVWIPTCVNSYYVIYEL